MPKSFSYGDYLAGLGGSRFTAADDSGYQRDSAVDEGAWGRMSDDEQWGQMGQSGGGSGWMPASGQGFTLPENSDIARRWAAANQRPDYMAEMGQERNRFYVTRDRPDAAQLRGGAWQDPETGSWVVPHENVRPEILQEQIDRVNNSGVFRGRGFRPVATGIAMVLGGAAAAGAFAPAAGALGASEAAGAGAWGLAGEATAADLAAYEAAMAGEVGASAGGSALGAGLEDVPASVLESGGGPSNSYWSQLADSGQVVSDAGGASLGESGMPFEPGLDIPSFEVPPGEVADFANTGWSPSADATPWERFINDPMGYGSRAITGGNMPSAGGYGIGDSLGLESLGLSNSDYLSLLRSLGSGYMNQRNQNQTREDVQQNTEAGRAATRSQTHPNYVGPEGSRHWTQVIDPATGERTWTLQSTLSPEEQRQYEARLGNQSLAHTNQARVSQPGFNPYGAMMDQSFGGQYIAQDPNRYARPRGG